MKKLAILLAVSMFALSGCSWFGSKPTAAGAPTGGAVTKESVTAAITSAEAAMKKTEGQGGGWRDTEKLIKDAKTALEKGELDNAMKLAKTAQEEAKLSEQQVMENRGAKPWLF